MRVKSKTICLDDSGYNSGDDMFFTNFFNLKRPAISFKSIGWRPQTDMYETEDEIVVIAELAGIDEKNLKVILEKDALIIRGIRQEECAHKKRQYYDMEIEYGPFMKTLKLPSSVDCDNVRAVYKHGFLEITMKKSDISHDRFEINIR